MMKKLMVLILSCIVVLGFQACKKEQISDTIVVPDPFDFEVIGDQYVFSNITLKTNLSEKKKLTWQFGDGESVVVNDTRVSHTYTQPGTYSVTVNVEDGKDGSLTKSITITNGTEKLGGNRRWSFLLARTKDGFPIDHIPPSRYQQTFALTIQDDNTIIIPNIDNIPAKGPYTVLLDRVENGDLIFQNNDASVKLTYSKEDNRGFISIRSKESDITYKLDGYADVFE